MTSRAEADAFEARCLLRAARQGALATVSAGEPHASLVTPATTGEGDVLLLLSDLSLHTRALAEAPACALLVGGPAIDANPQTAPRVSIHGEAVRLGGDEADRARARYVAIHPYAAPYAGFADFGIWRIRPASALFVGGFGRARKLTGASLTVATSVADALRDAEAALIRAGGSGTVAIDADGIDRADPDPDPDPDVDADADADADPGRGTSRLTRGTRRCAFDAPAGDPASFEAALGRLAARRGLA